MQSMQQATAEQYKTDTASDASKSTFQSIKEMWLQDPYGTLRFDLTEPTMWKSQTTKQRKAYIKAVADRDKTIQDILKEAPPRLESFREYRSVGGLAKSQSQVHRSFPDPIDPYKYVDLDNGHHWHNVQTSIRNLQNDLYFRTLQYLPRMMNKVTQRMYQAAMNSWYKAHNCHGVDRVKSQCGMFIAF